ncbi:hypothetical protein C5167_048276 [Papaver somniferum]|uniref:RING-type domain-containing protein n=1 Tax=Papaver somniferum TaxID=3469 RepID=A0A4Y7KL31_PAPSO|nr:RING-H2 finger protein ATL39-like [Papaver somniferum]RZC72798.1 hypothetical protein C5167_048276 [Papaver somniferum]
MLGSGMNLITTIIGFGMSATFIVFVCTRLICGRLRAADSRPVFEMDSRTDLEQPEHRITGLEPVVVASLPTMKFNRADFQSAEDAQCSICLGDYEEKEILRIMPKCNHNFHLSCIDVWLEKQSTCPVCRISLQESSSKPAISPRFGLLVQSVDGSHVINDYSHPQQWSHPYYREHSNSNSSNQGLREPIPRNSDTTITTYSIEVVETRR